MFTIFFTDAPVENYTLARRSSTETFARFFKLMLGQGIYLPPSQFESVFVSLAHSEEDLQKTVEAIRTAFRKLRL